MKVLYLTSINLGLILLFLFTGNFSHIYAAEMTTGFYPVTSIENYEPSTGWTGSTENIKKLDGISFANTYVSGNATFVRTHINFPPIPQSATIIGYNFKITGKHERTSYQGAAAVNVRKTCTSGFQNAVTKIQPIFAHYSTIFFNSTSNGGLSVEDINNKTACFIPEIFTAPDEIVYYDYFEAEVLYNVPDITPTPTTIPTPTSIPTPTPTPTPASLNVPYFSQNALPWGPSEYDHSKLLGVTGSDATMDRWGCAVTSVAMVLKYHNINQLPDGTPITPGSLNQWLNNNNGYQYGYDEKGDWYSILDWPVIGTLTQQIYDAHKSSVKLEHKRLIPSSQSSSILDSDLTLGNDVSRFPDILYVANFQTDGHFVVVKGKLDNTYAINDPEWNYSDLSSFGNIYKQVDRFIPSHTNLSYISASINPDTQILITDQKGNKTGKVFENGILKIYDEIPNANYIYQGPISNPANDGTVETLGTGANVLLIPTPSNGNYVITLSSLNNSFYTFNLSTYQTDGTIKQIKSTGTLSSNLFNRFTIDYSQNQVASVNKVVTFTSTLEDINNLRLQNRINYISAMNLYAFVRNAEKFHNMGKDRHAESQLDLGIKFVNSTSEIFIDDIAKTILLNDLQLLKASL